MRSITMVCLVAMVFGIIAFAYNRSTAAEPASQPASRPNLSDPDVVRWWAHCDFVMAESSHGRRAVSGIAGYVPSVPVPEKSVAGQPPSDFWSQRPTTNSPWPIWYRKGSDGHYTAPGSIGAASGKYIDLLRGSPLKATLRFAAKGPNDPVLILDDKKVVGVMMPMKS